MDFGKGWDSGDSALLGAALGSVYADIKSQKDLNARGGQETNPLLGKNPSGQDLDHAGLVAGALGTGVAAMLPPDIRKEALGAWAGLEAGLAYHNAHVNAKDKPSDLQTVVTGGPLAMALAGAAIGHLMKQNKIGLALQQYNGETVPAVSYKTGF